MNRAIDVQPVTATGDVVLREVWRAKDTLSAQYSHDLDRLFAVTRKHEKLSSHPLVRLPRKGRKR